MPNAWPILADPLAVASATPPTCFSTAPRMMVCASSVRFDSTRLAISAFCSSVKVTPDRPRDASPLIGSSSALPSCVALPVTDPKPAAARSTAACVARSNTPPASPAVLFTLSNVSSSACDSLIRFRSTPVSLAVASACSTSRSVTASTWPPKLPIEVTTASMRAFAVETSSNASNSFLPMARPAAPTARKATPMALPTLRTLSPIFATSSPALFVDLDRFEASPR